MFPIYSGKCLSHKAVHNWVDNSLKDVRKSQMMPNQSPCWDCNRSNCAVGGRVDSSWQEYNDRQCSNCTRVFPWYSIHHNAWLFEVSEDVCTVGSGGLKNWEKMNQIGLSLQHPLQYADEREEMLNRILTGDESWVHHYQPKWKRASVQWRHPSSPSTKKFKVTSMPSAGKVMLTMFWDYQGTWLAHFHKCGESVNSASYSKVLLKLWDAVCRKCPG
jgi:hypothetical protein